MLCRFLFEIAEITNVGAGPSFFLEDIPGIDLDSKKNPGKEFYFER